MLGGVSATQIKAARAILDWSQEDLAQSTGLSITTVRKLELGFSPRGTTMNIVRQAIEKAGIEFTDAEGVKRRLDEVKIYQGYDSCDAFFSDMLQTSITTNVEIIACLQSRTTFAQSCGISDRHNLERLETLKIASGVKCLVSEIADKPICMPSIQFRALPKANAYPVNYYIFGDKHAIVLSEGKSFRFVVFKSLHIAQSYRNHFFALWDQAMPLEKSNGGK